MHYFSIFQDLRCEPCNFTAKQKCNINQHYKSVKHLNNMKLLNQSENQQKNDLVPEKNQKAKLSKKELQDTMKKILETVIAYEDDGMFLCSHIF